MIKISKRLECVASKVKPDSVILDVGTDHGYLPMYLIENDIALLGIGSDVVDTIVESTRTDVAENALDPRLKIVLSDGLKDIDDEAILGCPVDTVIMTGMGGLLIIEILNERLDFIKDKKLILSPHRDADLVRRYLHSIGFKITDEDMIEDKPYKFYNVIEAEYGKDTKYNDRDYELGKILMTKIENKDFFKYLGFQVSKMDKIIRKIKQATKTDTLEELKQDEKIKLAINASLGSDFGDDDINEERCAELRAKIRVYSDAMSDILKRKMNIRVENNVVIREGQERKFNRKKRNNRYKGHNNHKKNNNNNETITNENVNSEE